MSRSGAIVIRQEKSEGGGAHKYNREDIYRYLWSIRDVRGTLTKSLPEVSEMTGVSLSRLRGIVRDFVTMGHIKKHGHYYFEIRYDPDHLEWGPKFEQRSRELSKRHQTKDRRAKYDPSYKGEENE